MKYKVCAFITAYEDMQAVQRCIEAILNQSYPISRIFIINNSKNKIINIEPSLTEKIVIQNHSNNIGVSQAIIKSILYTTKFKYDFLWTFDQDSIPLTHTLNILVNAYEELTNKNYKIGIISPIPVDIESNSRLNGLIFRKYKFDSVLSNLSNHISHLSTNFYECDAVITSGSLVSLQAAKNVEMPNKGLFIDAVDWDYCMKFRAKGYSVIVCTDAILKHNFGTYKSQSNDNKFLSNPIYCYSALRYYYMCRNHTYIETRLSKQDNYLHISIIYRIYSLFKKIAKVILYEQEQKILKVWACIRGTYDGFIGKLGKTW